MSYATWIDNEVVDKFDVGDEGRETAQYQLVAWVEPAVVVVYLPAGGNVRFWQEEMAGLYGVWPSVFEKGNFVEVKPVG